MILETASVYALFGLIEVVLVPAFLRDKNLLGVDEAVVLHVVRLAVLVCDAFYGLVPSEPIVKGHKTGTG